ncbi:lipase member H-like isoform X2 [Leguminivora glycinivorella]|nr:lipase member H-like isoform X2 [Leguminivora glycinivorella]XP_047993447.1 lipase member H-like isoform X2 [Leguminivora glycinivorella]XP_047993449.1 lipase member H-like isoform X2 [Leguminivora glycinivorella]
MSNIIAEIMLILTYIVVFCVIFVKAVEYRREDEGYPAGLLSDCPGSWKPAIITPKTLKKLYMSVVGDNHTGFTGHYNYYGMNELAKSPDMDFNKKTWIYIGGYMEANAWRAGRNVGYDYKARGYNVISLDTIEFTARHYPHAVRLSRAVGKHVAEMLVKLTHHGLDPKKLEITGMSLGAHTMGFAAKHYRSLTGQNISSLTALDGAGPCFRHRTAEERLDKSDADFVMSVVTTMDISSISTHFAHITFYVNGGAYQIGDIAWLPCDALCSHSRAYFVWWAAVVHPKSFIAVRCDTVQQARDGDCYDLQPMVTNIMGPLTDKSKPGIYYLRTSNRWPYALGRRGLKKCLESDNCYVQ